MASNMDQNWNARIPPYINIADGDIKWDSSRIVGVMHAECKIF
jgi:hypothetical protein